MDLFQEYENQQKWRDWERYFRLIPFRQTDAVIDLGCSLGYVSHLFSNRVEKVTGIDKNREFIDYCNERKRDNETFMCADIADLPDLDVGQINGVWSSFSLSYLNDPLGFLKCLAPRMEPGGWIALLDVSCFISGNLNRESRYHEKVLQFERESYTSGMYDFNFGSRMRKMLEEAGFRIAYVDDNVPDSELNFNGAASPEVISSWSARLSRMIRLREVLGRDYDDFCNDMLAELRSCTHEKRGNVRFVVARKATDHQLYSYTV